MFTLSAAAYNLVRMRNIQAANACGDVCPDDEKLVSQAAYPPRGFIADALIARNSPSEPQTAPRASFQQPASWAKTTNPNYSQGEARFELFESGSE